MIIVEGADNVGKSTLVRQLVELDPTLRVLHRARFKPGGEETIGTSYLNALDPKDGDRLVHANSLADRLVASECIYGELFRGECRMSDGEHLALRHVLNSFGAFVVHCDPPDKTIAETWTRREQLYDSPLEIAQAYRRQLREVFRDLNIIKYNWQDKSAETVRQAIVDAHRTRLALYRDRLAWWSANPYGIGQLDQPRVMLVGESPSPRATTPFPFAHGPAGNFLAWTIERAEQRLRTPIVPSIYVTNADKRGSTSSDATLLREEIRFLKPTVVVALGNEATQLLTYVLPSIGSEGPSVCSMPHPMFWRRFRFERRSEYVTKFLRAIEPAFPQQRALI